MGVGGRIVWIGLALTYQLLLWASELFAEEGRKAHEVYCLRRGDVAFFEKGVQLGPGGKEAADMVEIRFKGGKGEEVQRLWGMLYADDAGIVSRPSKGLERMMTVIVTACSSCGLTVSEEKTEIMCLETKGGGKVSFTINAAGQVYKQYIRVCVYLGGAITADRDLSIERTQRLQRASACFQRYKMDIYDRPRVCAYG